MKNRTISDLCGNEYYLEEAHDIKGKFLEVYEIVKVDNTKYKSYLCDIDISIDEDENNILDEIDDIKDKIRKD